MKSSKRKWLKRLARRGLYIIPRNRVLYRICKRYVDDYNGQNNCDMFTNGEIRFLRQVLCRHPGVVVFDVGANRGQWSEAVLSLNPLAQIHCFEPCTSTFKLLTRRGFPSNLICNNLGLASRSSIQQLHVFGEGHGQNSLYPRYDKEPQTTESVQFEYGENYVAAGVLLKDVIEFVTEFSYDLYKIMPRGLTPIRRYDVRLENFTNCVYVLLARHERNGFR